MLRALVADVVGVLLPTQCPGCGRRAAPICAACAATLQPPAPAPPPAGVDWWVSAFAYRGVARELVARAKYRDQRAALAWLGDRVAAGCARLPCRPDAVTWAPASAERRRARGVDHGELLARAVAAALDRPCLPLLTRAAGAPQTGRSARNRREGPRLRARPGRMPEVVLVVDDVTTTGATLSAAARALRTAGTRRVLAATGARTPPRGRGAASA